MSVWLSPESDLAEKARDLRASEVVPEMEIDADRDIDEAGPCWCWCCPPEAVGTGALRKDDAYVQALR